MIFDGHAYCVPPLNGSGEFASAEQLRRHLQQAIGAHFQPPLRSRDGAPGDNAALVDMSNWHSLDSLKEANFKIATNGRFEWTVDGEDFYKQYFPPSVTDMQYPADRLVAEMDYAGVSKALLHRVPYLGIGNEFISDCVRQFPDRLTGLAHVEEWLVKSEPDASIAKIDKAVHEGGLSGIQFLPAQMSLYNHNDAWDASAFRPFWDGIAALDIPVFITLKERGDPQRESYLKEVATLIRWMERYPDVTVVLTHGLQWRLFVEGDQLVYPDDIWAPFDNPNLHLQLMFPIGLGAVWEYPMREIRPTLQECVERIGSDRLMWGTDMPIVMRFWTYRQNIDFFVKHCSFLSDQDMQAIMGGTMARIIGGDA